MSPPDRPDRAPSAEPSSHARADAEPRWDAPAPRLLDCMPAHGECGVPPGPGLLVLRFDRPMGAGMSLFGDVPEVTGRPQWDETRRVLRIPVRLEAGARYRLLLNAESESGFQDADGALLAPCEWEFTVRRAALSVAAAGSATCGSRR